MVGIMPLIHVTPINDLIDHMESKSCPCKPIIKDGVCIHNSADAREQIEAAEATQDIGQKLNYIAFYVEHLFLIESKELVSASKRREMTKNAIARVFINAQPPRHLPFHSR